MRGVLTASPIGSTGPGEGDETVTGKTGESHVE
jgi:hypothetical protein